MLSVKIKKRLAFEKLVEKDTILEQRSKYEEAEKQRQPWGTEKILPFSACIRIERIGYLRNEMPSAKIKLVWH